MDHNNKFTSVTLTLIIDYVLANSIANVNFLINQPVTVQFRLRLIRISILSIL